MIRDNATVQEQQQQGSAFQQANNEEQVQAGTLNHHCVSLLPTSPGMVNRASLTAAMIDLTELDTNPGDDSSDNDGAFDDVSVGLPGAGAGGGGGAASGGSAGDDAASAGGAGGSGGAASGAEESE